MTTRDWLEGAIDCHVHTAPDLIERFQTDIALAHEARESGMRGVLVKSHVVPTAGRVDLVNEVLAENLLYGGVALNGAVGGLNRDAVETAIGLGARVVWLPTAWSANHARRARAAGNDRFVGQRIPSKSEDLSVAVDGEVTDQTRAIIELAAEHDVTVGTGHVSPEEIDAVVAACSDANVTCVVNHPFFHVIDLDPTHQEKLANQGAIMEYCAYSVQAMPDHSIDQVADALTRVGADNAVLATDFGQANNPPVTGLARFAEQVHEAGVSEGAVRTALTETPRRVLGLDV